MTFIRETISEYVKRTGQTPQINSNGWYWLAKNPEREEGDVPLVMTDAAPRAPESEFPDIPEYLVPYFVLFSRASGLKPDGYSKGKWLMDARRCHDAGISPETLAESVAGAREKFSFVKDIGTCFNLAHDLEGRKKSRVTGPYRTDNCDLCHNVRKVHIERPVSDPRFGRLEPCPRCSKTL